MGIKSLSLKLYRNHKFNVNVNRFIWKMIENIESDDQHIWYQLVIKLIPCTSMPIWWDLIMHRVTKLRFAGCQRCVDFLFICPRFIITLDYCLLLQFCVNKESCPWHYCCVNKPLLDKSDNDIHISRSGNVSGICIFIEY